MKIQIDLKSVLCGLAIGVAAMFVVGAESPSSNPVGKYQVEVGAPGAIILDTQTGEAWGAPNNDPGRFNNKTDKFWGAK